MGCSLFEQFPPETGEHEKEGQEKGQSLRQRNRQPQPGDPPDPWQQQDPQGEKAEGPQERENGGNSAVGEGREESGSENVQTREKEAV